MTKITSINPPSFSQGTTDCTIQYTAKSRDEGKGTTETKMTNSEFVCFIEDGRETHKLREREIELTNTAQNFEIVTQIRVKKTEKPCAAIIKVVVTDILNNKSGDNEKINYE